VLQLTLVEPEIAPNTGNVARLCAATGATLHLVGRLGFHLDDRSLRRAGLDYWPAVTVRRYDAVEAFERAVCDARLVCFSVRAQHPYTQIAYEPDDYLVFGSESRGLPQDLLRRHAASAVHIPMPSGRVRSLNLATAAGIGLYEALRQLHNW
jgi:tRNA (cytidine/uridine-2'-O-)-methyltransferase